MTPERDTRGKPPRATASPPAGLPATDTRRLSAAPARIQPRRRRLGPDYAPGRDAWRLCDVVAPHQSLGLADVAACLASAGRPAAGKRRTGSPAHSSDG